jgi:uncharacterized protein with PQ loop repeat
VHLGELSGWTSVALGQLVSWPQVLKLRRERGDGVSLASYAIVLVSMSLFLVHVVAIGDTVSTVSVPLSLIPNAVIAVTLVRRRRTGAVSDRQEPSSPSEDSARAAPTRFPFCRRSSRASLSAEAASERRPASRNTSARPSRASAWRSM